MNDLTQFSTLVALIALSAGLYAFLWNQLNHRVDRIEDKIDGLRRDLAEEFRSQRAEIAAQVTAIASAINASRRP